jgi:hypothetical protein
MSFELSLRQMNVVLNLTVNFFKIYFNIILLYVAQSPELSLAAGFPIKIFYAVSPLCASYISHPSQPPFSHSLVTIKEGYRL